MIPSQPIVVDTVIKELEKINLKFHKTIEMKAKF
jgi:hypothetical protein